MFLLVSIPLRVLHLATGNLYGGVEVYLCTLAGRGSAAGMTAEFTVCWEGRLAADLRTAGARVHSLGAVRLSRPWRVWAARWRLARLLRSEPFDVALVHSAWTHALFGPVIRWATLPLVMGVHTLVPRQSRLERWARRTPLEGVFANSQFTATSVRSWYPGHLEADVILLPVESIPPVGRSERDRLRADLGASPGDCVIVQASRMQAWKGVHTLIAALLRMGSEPAWKAWIAGGAQRPEEQAYEAGLKAQIHQAGLADRVTFLGQRTDVPALLAAADVHVQLNQTPEPFGIVFVEAAYAGIPSISAREGGAAEFVDESCGVRLASGDYSGLARELESLVRDPVRRRILGAAGPSRAESLCDPGRQTERLASFLRTLLLRLQ